MKRRRVTPTTAEETRILDECTSLLLDAVAKRERLAPGESLLAFPPDITLTREQLDGIANYSPNRIRANCLLILRIAERIKAEEGF